MLDPLQRVATNVAQILEKAPDQKALPAGEKEGLTENEVAWRQTVLQIISLVRHNQEAEGFEFSAMRRIWEVRPHASCENKY